jgi:DNA-binding LacI/PurR family transcriptional regulator
LGRSIWQVLRRIAKKAGVSICTVSKYLNGKLAVKEKTAERIESAIAELGYYPIKLPNLLKLISPIV